MDSNSLPTVIHSLRLALDNDGRLQEIIKTIPKKGYLLNKYFLAISITPTEFVSTDTSDNDQFLPKEQTESDNLKTMKDHIFLERDLSKMVKINCF